MKSLWRLLALASLAAALCPLALAQGFPAQFRDIGIEQHPGSRVPLNAEFRDQSGATVHLRDYFGSKPVLLLPVYYTCPTLCSQALHGLVEGISPLSLRPGRDFEIVAFSFDPTETPANARTKLNECMMDYAGRRGLPGWHFLTGSPQAIQSLTQAIGFRYRYDAAHRMFIHASGMVVATPDGRSARYLWGVAYQPRDLRDAIRMAAQNRIGAAGGAIRLLCYPFASSAGQFDRVALLMLRCAAGGMLIALAAGLIALWRRDLNRDRHPASGATP